MSEIVELPLFPLRTVLFPGGVLPLRIFEPRYVDMIGRCMRQQHGFGVVLIRQGSEARLKAEDAQPQTFEIGTEAQIVDFNQADNGLLGIVTRGGRKFRVRETYEESDHLLMGRVEYFPEESPGELLPEHEQLVDVLKELTNHPLVQKLNLQVNFDEARSVSFRLAELLPIEPEIKQSLLQLRMPRERLTELSRIVSKFQG
jgi:uncharacterized protein